MIPHYRSSISFNFADSNNTRKLKKEHSRKQRGQSTDEPRREKTGLQGLRPGPTQIGLYKLRKELEA